MFVKTVSVWGVGQDSATRQSCTRLEKSRSGLVPGQKVSKKISKWMVCGKTSEEHWKILGMSDKNMSRTLIGACTQHPHGEWVRKGPSSIFGHLSTRQCSPFPAESPWRD